MLLLYTTYPNNPRALKKFITWLIKSGMVFSVQRINYVKSYYLHDDKVQQQEEKILFIKCHPDNKAKIEWYFAKNHPVKTPEMIRIHPDAVQSSYLT